MKYSVGYQMAGDSAYINEIIKLIRAAKADDEAKSQLMDRFGLSEAQANAILEMS